MTTTRKILISFTAGVILGILYAPGKGSKTRKKLASIGSGIKNGWENLCSEINNGMDVIERYAEGINNAGVDSIEIREVEIKDRSGFL
ncbi:MAG: YtxH domain-containing protein [Bacteroidetes bacterium]|nr:YtxH domain-containing protein [Bacteroidota bacterium]